MSEHNLLLESDVLIVGANVAAASVLAGLAGLSLRLCVGRRSLPLQHGVLTAALAVLLLAPLCLVLSAGVPGIGIEWRIANVDPAGDAVADDTFEDAVTSVDDESSPVIPIESPAVVATADDDTSVALDPLDVGATGWYVNGEAVPVFPRPEPELFASASDPDTSPEPSPAVAPVIVAESRPDVPHDDSATVAVADPATPAVDWDIRSLGSILLLIWTFGVVVGLAHCAAGFLLVARLRRQARRPESPLIESLAGSVAAQLGMRRFPHVLLSDRVEIPLTLGLRSPAIVLPADLVESASESRLRAILLHEAAHVVRHDLWIGVLQRLVAALYWWNPLVHRLNRQLNDVRESLCDNHVMLAGEDVRDYADTLLTLAARIA